MRIVAISDTHKQHSRLQVPDGDVLVHAGDFLGKGLLDELMRFNHWLGRLPHAHKIVIAGNHDWCFQRQPERSREVLTNAIYLQDEAVTLDGVKFYGAPWQPAFRNWAFNIPRNSPEMRAVWDQIPLDTDVLITHGPAYGVLDWIPEENVRVGCELLAERVQVVKPRYHIFGHIHESYGQEENVGVTSVNASCLDRQYRLANAPWVLEI